MIREILLTDPERGDARRVKAEIIEYDDQFATLRFPEGRVAVVAITRIQEVVIGGRSHHIRAEGTS